jgi:Ran-binding protein 1
MADAKPDPAAEQATNPAATLQKDQTAKVTTDITDAKPAEDKPVASTATEDKPATSTVTETVANAASTATTAVKDNVFSMFGGGPKKEKKEEVDDDTNEPSGASKPKGEVSKHTWRGGGVLG